MVMLRKNNAFGMIEAIIALSITCIVLSISITGINQYKLRIEEKQFLQSFKFSWTNTLNYSYLSNSTCEMIVLTDEQKIVFKDIDENKELNVVKIPEYIKYGNGGSKIIKINGSSKGYTIIFISSLSGKRYTFKVQLHWGEILENVEKI
ncbi:type II secretion system protein [Lactobacillus terrae]|uniref:type II secretion system protein n=1 Tax=Lactobacillus terrae TaxID=2269374 RepID=UPI000C1B77AC|nr:type II secretion system protein [Lactobacillus terrae]